MTAFFNTLLSTALVSTLASASLANMVQPPSHAPPETAALFLVGQGYYLCEARLFGKKARLWLKVDKPVQYQWSNRKALSAEMKGNTIYIAATPTATLSDVMIGQTSDGKKAIQGNWTFKSNTQDGVVFTCLPK